MMQTSGSQSQKTETEFADVINVSGEMLTCEGYEHSHIASRPRKDALKVSAPGLNSGVSENISHLEFRARYDQACNPPCLPGVCLKYVRRGKRELMEAVTSVTYHRKSH